MVSIERFVRVKSLAEAYELNQDRSNTVLGGFMWLKMGNRKIENAIDLSGLSLDTIEETGEEFSIGCMCSLRTLELHEGLHHAFQGVIREAVHHIVGVQFRNGATVGGSVYGRFGFSDVLTCLLALDCYVELYKGGIVPLHEFATMKSDNDILVRIHIKKDGRRASYQSQRITRTDFPIIAAAAAKKDNTLFISIGARPGKASLLIKDDCLLDENSADDEIAALAEWARDQYKYGSDIRAGQDYRRHLAFVYVKRALQEILRGVTA